jgi:macrolide transport system ATP-binding/permease protein
LGFQSSTFHLLTNRSRYTPLGNPMGSSGLGMLSARFRVFVAQIRGLFTLNSSELNLDEELRFHMDMAIEEHRRSGMSADEARSAALRQFGSIESTKEQYRELRSLFWLETSVRDLAYAWRTLTKNWGFSTVAVVSLMLGIGGSTAIFSLMDAVLLRSLPVRNPEQLWFLMKTGGRSAQSYFSLPFYQQLESHNELCAGMLAFFDAGGTLQVSADLARLGNSSEMVQAQLTSGNYFSALGVKPILGRAFTMDDDREQDSHPVAVISYSYWRRRFSANTGAVGAKILLNGTPFTVVGITPPGFFGLTPGSPPDITVPLMMQSRIWLDPGDSIGKNAKFGWLRLMIRLRPDITEQRVQAGLSVLSRQINLNLVGSPATQAHPEITRIELTPGARGLDSLRMHFSRPLSMLMALALLVVLVACANIAVLLLARSASRQREIGTRLALGATRQRIIRQLLTESLMLAGIGAISGLLFACAATEFLLKILASSPVPTNLTFALDQHLFLFTAVLALITGLLCGTLPALQATSPDVAQTLSRGAPVFRRFGARRARRSYGKILVVGQLSLSLVLLVAASLFVTSLNNLQGLNAGFNPQNLLLVTVNPSLVGYREPQLSTAYQELLRRIRGVPGILSATISSHSLLTPGVDDSSFVVPGRTPRSGEPHGVNLNLVGSDFFETLGTPIMLGRAITTQDDEHAPHVGVITESLAHQYFGGENPIGKHISLGGPTLEIVGVAQDVKFNSLHDEAARVVFLSYRQRPAWHPPAPQMTFAVRTREQDSDGVAFSIRRLVSEYDRSLPIASIKTAEMQITESLVQERLLAWLAGAFGTLGLVLACVGLTGTMSYAVARRTNEIGIRMAVGAQRSQVVWTFMRESIALSVTGSLLGLVLACALSRLATRLLFSVKPTDPFMLAASALLLIVVVIGAASLPAWRAGRVDPAITLRCE